MKMDDDRVDVTIRTELRGDEKYATGSNITVYMNDRPVPYLARCTVDMRADGIAKVFLEQIPNALDLELKNVEANVRFAYQDNTFWHELRTLIDERNRRLDRETGKYKRPMVVCLCGSVRFRKSFIDADEHFSLQGWIVVQPGVWGRHEDFHSDDKIMNRVKKELGEVHLRKIEMSDIVYVINEGGYIGESTSREIEHAKRYDKPVLYMFDDDGELSDLSELNGLGQ